MQDFREIKVWQKAHQLTPSIYKTTKHFPKSELYGLTNQVRRCSSSIPSNIAEGSVQQTDAQFSRYLRIALGSAKELDYQILLAHELEYISNEEHEHLRSEIEQIKKMLTAFIRTLRA